jgi:hypothetical protein
MSDGSHGPAGAARRVTGREPDPQECSGPKDAGKIHHDEEHDIWYECVLDRRRGAYTWAIVPPVE